LLAADETAGEANESIRPTPAKAVASRIISALLTSSNLSRIYAGATRRR
jgi:hypothetical protein